VEAGRRTSAVELLVGRSHRVGRPLLEPMSVAADCRPSAAHRFAAVLIGPSNPCKGRDGANSIAGKDLFRVARLRRRSLRRAVAMEQFVPESAHEPIDRFSQDTTHPSESIQSPQSKSST
jgi:hypothetical protein